MAEYNVKINVKTDTGYDQLYPKSKADIIDFDKSNSNLSSNNVEVAIKEVNTKANTNKTNIGTLASLKTDSKTNLVGAINEVDSHTNTAQSTANTNKTNIGTLSNLKTTIKNSIVNAINWLYDNVVHKTSIIDNLDDIVANQADGMVAGAKSVSELYEKTNEKSYELTNMNFKSFWSVTNFSCKKQGKKIFFSMSLNTDVQFYPNVMYELNDSPIPEEIIPKKQVTLPSIACGSNWENASSCIVNVRPDGYIEIISPVKQIYYKVNGFWIID